MLTPTPPVFSYAIRHYAGRNILCITDDYDAARPSITVTNTAEYVLKNITKAIGELPRLVIYRDTAGKWDRLVLDEKGDFLTFSPVVPCLEDSPSDLDEALQLLVLNTVNSLHGVM